MRRRVAMVSWLVAAGWLAVWPMTAHGQNGGFAPQQMLRQEGKLGTTGQVHEPVRAVDDNAAPISEPNPFEDRAAEKRVAVPAPTPPPVATSVPSEVMALDTNMPARISDVLACRLEIATDRRVKVDKVLAGTILLRWTVKPGGGVSDAEAVAQKNTDPAVLSCARRKMETWVFVRGPGDAPLKVEQTVKFE